MTQEKIRFLSPEPKLAIILAEREPKILPEDVYAYLIEWIQDVGSTMRTREYMVSMLSAYTSLLGASALLRILPDTNPLDRFLKRLGYRE